MYDDSSRMQPDRGAATTPPTDAPSNGAGRAAPPARPAPAPDGVPLGAPTLPTLPTLPPLSLPAPAQQTATSLPAPTATPGHDGAGLLLGVPTLPTLPPLSPPAPAEQTTTSLPAPTPGHDGAGVLLGVPTLPTSPPPSLPAPVAAPAAPDVAAAPVAFHPATKASLKMERKRARIRARRGRSWLGTFFMWRLIVAAVVLAVSLGAAGIRAIQDRLADDEVAAWDPRVIDLVAFVEQERGLVFDHPVRVDFLAPADYSARAGEGAAGYDAADREYFASIGEIVNASGLAVGYDPIAGQSTITSAGTLGLYDPIADEIWVRGDQLDAPTRVTLVHELTHALQAQHFDLDRDEIGFAFRSVVEADARRVELVYVDSLTDAEREAIDASYVIDPAADAAMSTVPWAIRETFDAPYVLGPAVVDAAFADGGNAAVDRLLTANPTEEILVSPWLDGTDQTETLLDVQEPEGAAVLDGPRPLGMWETLVMLDAWLPWTEARGVLDAWDGGGYVSYVPASGTGACFSAAVALDGDPAAFATAIEHWASASGSGALPVSDGNTVSFTACSRGQSASAPPEPVVGPLFAAYLEAGAVEDFRSDGASTDVAICVARQLIDHPGVAPLLELETLDTAQTALFDGERVAAHTLCTAAA